MDLCGMPLNFNQLRLFLAVAEHGGVTRAAEAIFVSQPAISKAVHELEREIGVPLLAHVGRRVELTEAGEILADYARRIFALAAEGRQAMDELRGLERGRLAVGASTTIGIYLLPRLMGRYHARHPAIATALDIGNTEQVLAQLRAGALDLALVEGPVTGADLAAEPYLRDELVLITAPAHPFAALPEVPLDALAREPFLLREPGSGTREVVARALAERGVEPPVAMELGHTEAIKQAVAAGLGVSILSRLTVEREVAQGLLATVPIAGLTIGRHFLLVRRRGARPSAAAHAWLDVLREEYGQQRAVCPPPGPLSQMLREGTGGRAACG